MHAVVQARYYAAALTKRIAGVHPLLPDGCLIYDQGCVVVMAGSQKGRGQATEGGAAC